MVKHIQTIPRQQPTNCLCVFDHFVGLVLKEIKRMKKKESRNCHKQVHKKKNNVDYCFL